MSLLMPAHPGNPGKEPLNGCVCVRTRARMCVCVSIYNNNNNNNHGNVYGAVIMTEVNARVHPVHLMNAD